MPGSATDMVKSSYMEEEAGNQVDAVAVVDVDTVATFSTADNTTPHPYRPPPQHSTAAAAAIASRSHSHPMMPPPQCTVSSSSVVPSIEAVETSSLPSMSTSTSATGTAHPHPHPQTHPHPLTLLPSQTLY
ncbi:soluble scavenger receptor cysteine-rich domain-containing protein SSC5D-like [Drosophila miranda]|uniref:soluble scavenger receptor cysteine-rich domain-containing protein SSC5D-like n=1 Tax=Drosophila miranda TaxID=7229 RepID=UPI00143FB7B9|nr:soluble scavenger receptor cysteine-rich domain-containing protein SSC5D-like [Drosophila miranda]